MNRESGCHWRTHGVAGKPCSRMAVWAFALLVLITAVASSPALADGGRYTVRPNDLAATLGSSGQANESTGIRLAREATIPDAQRHQPDPTRTKSTQPDSGKTDRRPAVIESGKGDKPATPAPVRPVVKPEEPSAVGAGTQKTKPPISDRPSIPSTTVPSSGLKMPSSTGPKTPPLPDMQPKPPRLLPPGFRRPTRLWFGRASPLCPLRTPRAVCRCQESSRLSRKINACRTNP